MSSRVVRAGLVLVIGCWPWLVAPAAAQSVNRPLNFQVSNLTPGPGRFQVSLVYDWDPPLAPGVPVASYQLNSGCVFTAPKLPLTFSGNSGLTIVHGQVPHYRLEAICTCDRYRYIGPAVRAYSPSYSDWVMLATLPGPAWANHPGWFEAPCKQTK